MDARTRSRFRRRLLAELGERGDLLDKMLRSVQERGAQSIAEGGAFANHMADSAAGGAELESDYILCEVQERDVQEILFALRRIDEGIYGACEACGSDIAMRRLEVHPSARFCLQCQERKDRLARN